ncbi:phosphopantothenoylcysteine decarboxylase, partial [Geodermatophilus sp. DF01_2]|uniref:phosphopantothenoylcysteine decarboxylase domain-containing protein n=1 Tax=Geodermatophilus sp. DF01-2 TaxID=2559610 RepID=UPI002474A30A
GARVTLVAANTALADPAGVDVVRVGTAVQLREAVLKAAADADAVVMAAAVADFRPAEYADLRRLGMRAARAAATLPVRMVVCTVREPTRRLRRLLDA